MASATKRKRISKKNKSAWRKTDVQDVDQFLEDQRQQERIGSFADQSDDVLFTIDATPQKPRKSNLTDKQSRKLNAKKPLRSLLALENTSKVQDPIAKRNHVKLKKSGRIIEEEVCNPTKPRHFQANSDRARYYAKVEEKVNENKELRSAKDIWAEEDFRDKIPGLKDEKGWVSRDLALYTAKNIGKPVIKVHGGLRNRTTKAKNFEPPHPGISYNPSLEDHQNLIEKVVDREEKIIKEEKHLKRVTTRMFKKITPEERDARYRLELSADVDEDGTVDEEKHEKDASNETDDAPYKTLNPPVEREKKKSKQARSKELKQKELRKQQDEKKALKKQVADLNRIKSIKAEILVEEEELNALKKHRKQVEMKKKFETKRLGRLKYSEPDIEINMPEDITGNLRNIQTESSLLVDRFKNFQKRNILPVSVATGKQKAAKIKRFPRSSHKEPGVSFQMLREQRKAAKKQLNISQNATKTF